MDGMSKIATRRPAALIGFQKNSERTSSAYFLMMR